MDDLVAHSAREEPGKKEILMVRYVIGSFLEGGPFLKSETASPLLLLGDSHVLVFSDRKNFHCDGAGLFDHPSFEMGRALDLEGSAGGGLINSRVNLFRKAVADPGYWKKKKVVVWVFAAREFTQTSDKQGFISIPIERE